MTDVHLALILTRVAGLAIAIAWLVAFTRVHRRTRFDGKRQVELIAVAFTMCGLAAFTASFVQGV